MQLLGYASLINLHHDWTKINKIAVIHCLLGKITEYNISTITKDQQYKYICYYPVKKPKSYFGCI